MKKKTDRVGDFREKYTQIVPCAVADTPGAHHLWLKVGPQRFQMSNYLDTVEFAELMRTQLAKALVAMCEAEGRGQ